MSFLYSRQSFSQGEGLRGHLYLQAGHWLHCEGGRRWDFVLQRPRGERNPGALYLGLALIMYHGLQGTSRVSRIQLLLFKDGLKIALISLDVSDSRFLFPLRIKALSVE